MKRNIWEHALLQRRYMYVAFCCGLICIIGAGSFFLRNVSFAGTLKSPGSVNGGASGLILVPMPHEIRAETALSLKNGVSISTASGDPEDNFAAKDLVSTLKRRGVDVRDDKNGSAKIVLLRQETKKAKDVLTRARISFDPAMHDEGYALVTDGDTMYDIAATSAGMYYGAQTIKQLIVGRHENAALHAVVARDWPAMKYRGLDDDLGHGPIPTLAFQKHQVRVLSEYKVNIYSPYFENELAYAASPLAAPPGGTMTRADVEELVRYAQKYHVTIVPEQEAFGHLHHALVFDTYSQLAETPHGNVLAPGQPGSIQLIQQWFTEIASMFPGPFMHIGADETRDLGIGQTKPLVEREGVSKAYIDFVKQIYTALEPLHKRLLFWGDIAMKDPALVKTLPKDMIAVAWRYHLQPEGYDKWLLPFVDAGMETWVAPAAAYGKLVYPNNYDALHNIQGFVRDGQRLGSTGELNTVWNDAGEGVFNQDWYGVLFGAAASWQTGTSSIPQFENSYGQVFHGDLTGKINQAQMEIMAAQLTFRQAGLDSATDELFWIDPWSQQGQIASAKLLPVVHEMRLHAERAIILIDQARAAGPLRETDAVDAVELGARRIDFIGYKFQAAQEIIEEYDRAYKKQNDPANRYDVGQLLATISGGYGQCQDLRNGYGLIRDLHKQVWLSGNRPYWLDNIMAHYYLEMELWTQRSDQFNNAIAQFHETHTLPEPEDMGLPTAATF